jgi:hypothetical protein
MVLATGPTGSGKTTTLYALLREIFSTTRNIITIEDPIEYQLKGINQVEINDRQGLTFAGVLRSVLRQDPDVILVGEIRDQETARIAFQAAQTGHLVLSTLHTNDAAATITRLIDLGVEPYVVSSSVNLILAQRLVRQVCPECSAPYEPGRDAVALLGLERVAGRLRRGVGCPACRQGYAGRLGVYEVVPISPTLGRLIESGAGESALRQAARSEGFGGLQDDAVAKLLAGATTAEEVLRVVQVTAEAASEERCAPAAAEAPALQVVELPPASAPPAAAADGLDRLLEELREEQRLATTAARQELEEAGRRIDDLLAAVRAGTERTDQAVSILRAEVTRALQLGEERQRGFEAALADLGRSIEGVRDEQAEVRTEVERARRVAERQGERTATDGIEAVVGAAASVMTEVLGRLRAVHERITRLRWP